MNRTAYKQLVLDFYKLDLSLVCLLNEPSLNRNLDSSIKLAKLGAACISL